MQFIAKARYVWYSPYKLRPLVNVIRDRDVEYALAWLATYRTKRSQPIKKALESAVANAKHIKQLEPNVLRIKEIRVDQGPTHSYIKPGAMGRAMPHRKRLCHISIILEAKTDKAKKKEE